MVMKCGANLKKGTEKVNRDTRGELKEEITRNSEIVLIFPEGEYSKWKSDITKLRKLMGCTEWDGSTWHGTNVDVNTMFYKTALHLGIEVEGEEDQLIITGNITDKELLPVIDLIRICKAACNGVVKISLHYPCTD